MTSITDEGMRRFSPGRRRSDEPYRYRPTGEGQADGRGLIDLSARLRAQDDTSTCHYHFDTPYVFQP